MRGELDRETLGEADYTEFARGVGADECIAAPSRSGGRIDDPSTLALRDHLAGCFSAAEEDAAEIHPRDLVPRLRARLDQWADRDRRRVVDGDVEAPEGGNSLANRSLDIILVRNVAGDSGCSTSCPRQLLGGTGRRLRVQGHHRDRGALLCEAPGDCIADAAGSAGDQSNLALETVHVAPSARVSRACSSISIVAMVVRRRPRTVLDQAIVCRTQRAAAAAMTDRKRRSGR
jgi:hypothetical protein